MNVDPHPPSSQHELEELDAKPHGKRDAWWRARLAMQDDRIIAWHARLGAIQARIAAQQECLNQATDTYELLQSPLVRYLVQDALQESDAAWAARLARRKAALEAEQTRLAEQSAQLTEHYAAFRTATESYNARTPVQVPDLAQDELAAIEARLVAERQAEQARLEAERHAEQQARLTTERETLAALVEARFPAAPLRLAMLIQQIGDPEQLRAFRLNLPSIADLATLEQQLRAAVPPR
ncbi:MAG: hypothetical protein HC911_17900 [Chloroflexaceae bacterium]|nr:hypothetical protein [Chloroflexaceae bacterium]